MPDILSEDRFHDYKNALAPIDSAISFWILTKDTAEEANLRKYKGKILGHLNRFEEGKFEINTAISLFKSLDRSYGKFGVAVAKYDLAQLLDLEGNIDSAIIYQLEACDFWLKTKRTSRIIGNNSQLIHLYLKKDLYQIAKQVQNSNELIFTDDLDWNTKIDFYCVSYQLFDLEGNEEKAALFKKQYSKELQNLKEKGIEIKSIFDTNPTL